MVRRICPKQSVVSEGMRGKWVFPVQSMHNVFMQGPFEETGIREKYHITETACQQVGEYRVFSQRLLPFLVTQGHFVLTPTREGITIKVHLSGRSIPLVLLHDGRRGHRSEGSCCSSFGTHTHLVKQFQTLSFTIGRSLQNYTPA